MSYELTANVCVNELISSKIAFNYKNHTYLISTTYVIDYPNKIINELNKLGISVINNYPDCNWYRIKQAWNTGVNTGNIYIQGPNYSVENVQSVINLLEKNYPITETLVGISLGLILPCILFFLFILYIRIKVKNVFKSQTKSQTDNFIKREIDNKIKDYFFNPPSYELHYESIFKKNLYYEYNENFHKYIDEKIKEYKNIIVNNNDNTCIKCKSEKVKLYKNKYDLYECEKCQL